MCETTKKPFLPTELITPELAKQFFKRNSICNKLLDERKVVTLIKKIKSGKWDSNGDAIYFSHGDILVNGQHCIHAIVRSGVSVYLRVFRMTVSE